MNIKPKGQQLQKPTAPQQRIVNLTPSQRKLYRTVWDAQFPHGKFTGRTAEYIYKNEKWYWDWCEESELLYQWEIKVLDGNKMAVKTHKPAGFWSNRDSCYWIGIRIEEL